MKLVCCILSVALILSGCAAISDELDLAMELRQKLLVKSCSFTSDITADYGDTLYNFQMQCKTDTAGNMTFTVTSPDTISGITGQISSTDAKLTFEGTVLTFPPLSGGKLAPVMAPWVFINTLRSGYLSGCGKEGEHYLILADDSYEENALQLEILTDNAMIPVQADIFWNQQRILSIQIRDFVIL